MHIPGPSLKLLLSVQKPHLNTAHIPVDLVASRSKIPLDSIAPRLDYLDQLQYSPGTPHVSASHVCSSSILLRMHKTYLPSSSSTNLSYRSTPSSIGIWINCSIPTTNPLRSTRSSRRWTLLFDHFDNIIFSFRRPPGFGYDDGLSPRRFSPWRTPYLDRLASGSTAARWRSGPATNHFFLHNCPIVAA